MTDFTQQTKVNQALFIGIDVHLRNWKVCIRSSSIEVKVFSCEPEPIKLFKFLQRNFPNYDYYKSVYQRLRKIPGIGPVCAVAFICEINNMKRFKNENQFASYVGLVPSVRSSD